MSSGSIFRFCAMAASLAAWPVLADNHTPEDVPQTFAEGFIQGVGVPVISLYHLAAMVGIGILVGIAARGVVPVLAFGAAAIVGVAYQLSPYDLPADDAFVALTTMIIGLLILLRKPISPRIASGIFAVAGLVHGYSLGAVVANAGAVPVLAYVTGLLMVQTAIGVAACAITLGATKWPAQRTALLVVGGLVIVAGGLAAIEAAGLTS
jgi:urease accessory protein